MSTLRLLLILGLIALLYGCTSGGQTKISKLATSQAEAEAAFRLVEMNDIKTARTRVTQAMHDDPKAASPWYVQAYIEEATGHPDQAKQAYLKAISLSPKLGQPHNNYATFLCHQGDIKAALKQFELAIADPKYYNTDTAYENAGLCALDAGQLDKAKDYFTSAVNTNPDLTHSLFELALIHYVERNYEESSYYLERYIKHFDKPSKLTQQLRADLKKSPHPAIRTFLPRPATQTW